ncbi:hypothetical protein C807_02201 [Lachnospiraceae bacterium 28-4]|nr:hypothetical protein C807_02201 [Lachnospiraceae bacterium 28-4]
MIKKALRKNIILGALALVVPFMIAGTCNINSYALEVEVVEDTDVLSESGVARSPIIEYRYKIIDGELYRRLFNYSDECWIGEWEKVPIKEP